MVLLHNTSLQLQLDLQQWRLERPQRLDPVKHWQHGLNVTDSEHEALGSTKTSVEQRLTCDHS